MLILRIVPRWANSCLKDCVYIIESNEFFSSHQAITTTTALLWWLINFWNPTPWTHSPHLSHCISVVFAGFTICKSEFTSDLPFEHWWTLWMANQLEIQSEGCPSIWVTESIVTSAQIIQLPEVYSAVDLSFQCAIRSHSSDDSQVFWVTIKSLNPNFADFNGWRVLEQQIKCIAGCCLCSNCSSIDYQVEHNTPAFHDLRICSHCWSIILVVSLEKFVRCIRATLITRWISRLSCGNCWYFQSGC